jgi:hypothetical protein
MSYKIIFISYVPLFFSLKLFSNIYIFHVLVVIWMSYTNDLILTTSPIYREGDDLLLAK